MRNKVKPNKNPFLTILFGTLIGLAVCVGCTALCAYIAAANDTDYEKYNIFLIVACGAGGLFSALFTGGRIKTKRFFLAAGQGVLTSLIFMLIVAVINSFSVAPFIFLLPVAGLIAGMMIGILLTVL